MMRVIILGEYDMVAAIHSERLNELKARVHEWDAYWKPNSDRFNDFFRFIFQSSLTAEDIQKLESLSKPTIEFNVLESMISRLRGEFAKQEPSIMVHAAEGIRDEDLTEEYVRMIEVIEAHMREILHSSSNDELQY